jgi:hypothetical protein
MPAVERAIPQEVSGNVTACPNKQRALGLWSAGELTSQEIADACGYADDAALRGMIHRARAAGDTRAIVKERFTGKAVAP